VPLIIQTKVRVTQRSGVKRVIEPKDIMSPKGKANTSVRMNIRHVSPNPCSSVIRIVEIAIAVPCGLRGQTNKIPRLRLLIPSP